jgi:hypothetical protein
MAGFEEAPVTACVCSAADESNAEYVTIFLQSTATFIKKDHNVNEYLCYLLLLTLVNASSLLIYSVVVISVTFLQFDTSNYLCIYILNQTLRINSIPL